METQQSLPRRVQNMTLRKKTFWLYMANIFFFLIVIFVYLFFIVRNDLIDKETAFLSDSLNQSCTQFSSTLDTYNRLSNYIFNDTSIQSTINQAYSMEDAIRMYQAYENVLEPSLNAYQMLTPNISSLVIYTDCGLRPYKTHIEQLQSLQAEVWYPRVENQYSITWLSPLETGKASMLSLRKLGFGLAYTYQNYLAIEVPEEAFFAPFHSLSGDTYSLVIRNQNDEVVYSYLHSEDGKRALAKEHTLTDAPGFLSADEALDALQWTVHYYKPASPLLLSIYINIAVLFLCLGGGAVLLLFLMYSLLSKTIINPIEALAGDMQKVQFGEPSQKQFQTSRTDEIGILMNNYHNMMLKINSLINEVYLERINAQEYQLKALRAQLNPHFLYNILSLISARAIMADNEDISNISQLLSKFYRTCLNQGDDFTTVYNEIENIRAYIDIQLIMNNQQFQVSYHIDEDIYQYFIPNLMLQPIVENAIMHGLAQSKKVKKRLCVTAALEEESLRFQIEDNGIGIPEEKIGAILDKKSAHFGLRSIAKRLTILYGSDYTLQIKSTKEEGTCIVISLPVAQSLRPLQQNDF